MLMAISVHMRYMFRLYVHFISRIYVERIDDNTMY